MAKKSKSRFAILGMLALHPKSSGYDLKKLLEESTDYFWKETFSSIYPVLDELEKAELIEQQKTTTARLRPRNLYSLSPKGSLALQQWLSQPAEMQQVRNELLLKLFFGNLSSPTLSRSHVEQYQQKLITKKAIFSSVKEQLCKEFGEDAGLPYWLITLDHGLRQVESAIQWCKESLSTLQRLEKEKEIQC